MKFESIEGTPEYVAHKLTHMKKAGRVAKDGDGHPLYTVAVAPKQPDSPTHVVAIAMVTRDA